MTNIMAELWALKDGLSQARQLNLQNINIELDVDVLVHLLTRKSLVPQKKPQLAHVASCGWWRGVPPQPLHQPQLTTWVSCDFFCGFFCGTRRTLLINPASVNLMLKPLLNDCRTLIRSFPNTQ